MSHAITESEAFFAQPAQEPRTAAGFTGSPVVAIGTAAVVVSCLFWSSVREPLPALEWAAAFLGLAIYQDVTRLRIPNWLTFPALAVAVAAAGITAGAHGLAGSLGGAGAALGILFFPFVLGWLGAGDVKATMVVGALVGATHLVAALWWMLVAGGVLAVVLISIRGGLFDLLRRWFDSARLSVLSGRIVYIGAPAGSTARSGLPFAVAMGLGVAAYQIWGSPWV
jgi:prepilin peptidase CpaA